MTACYYPPESIFRRLHTISEFASKKKTNLKNRRCTAPPASTALLPNTSGSPPGDSELFDDIYKKYGKFIYKKALDKVGANDAEDIMQDVMLRVWDSIEFFKKASEPDKVNLILSALNTITRCKSIDYYRKNKGEINCRELLYIEDTESGDTVEREIADEGASVEEQYIQSERIEHIKSIILSMPKDYQDVLMLVLLKEYSNTEAAKILGMDRLKVGVMVKRGKEKLRKILEKDPNYDDYRK